MLVHFCDRWFAFLVRSATAGAIGILCLMGNFSTVIAQNSLDPSDLGCKDPILSRLQSHIIRQGETLASIAHYYQLTPETLIRLNPSLSNGSFPVGSAILIPPFNGIRLEVPEGATWQDLAAAYGIRADVLFEINGCQKTPKVVFIPGVSWNPGDSPRQNNNYTGLKHYPLPSKAPIGLAYGWQIHPQTQKTFFHSGIDFLADIGTPVLAADAGTIAFAGQEGSYGLLVVIDHGKGRQTRYAHLSQVSVKIGQSVTAGEKIGATGVTGQPDIPSSHLHFEVRYQLPVGWVAQDPQVHLSTQLVP